MDILQKLPDIIDESKRIYSSIELGKPRLIEQLSGLTDEGERSSNMLWRGDNAYWLKHLQNSGYKEKIKLIYIDPPFYSKANYHASIKVGKETLKMEAFTDAWSQGLYEYLVMITTRLMAMKELLARDGTIWVHLDWHAVHYVKIIMDHIFGYDNFVNEIIWQYKSGGTSKNHYSRKHDTILVYSKTNKYYYKVEKEKSYNRGMKPYRFKGVEEYEDEIGWHTIVNMKDVWNIHMVGRTSGERTGYATQKPEKLLARIVETATEEGDICADFFCGSGTLPLVCANNKRKFIGSDVGELAIEHTLKRLSSVGVQVKVYEESSESKNEYKLKEQGQNIGTFRVRRKPNVEKNQEVCEIMIEDYYLDYTSIPLDSKSKEIVKDIRKKEPLLFVESVSIDWDYNGEVFRPEEFAIRENGKLKTTYVKTIKNDQKVCTKIVDIFGNSTYNVHDNILNYRW